MFPVLDQRIRNWLARANAFYFALYAASAAFCVYTCVYAYRKAFAVATFDGLQFGGVDYKVWLVVFQVAGYALSKFIGIKVIAELQAHQRKRGILLMAALAGLSWLLFAATPAPYNLIFLFTNGLPLGMVWGMVFGYLEGRRTTEALGAGLSVSFIFSAGFVKTAGAWCMQTFGCSEYWMPFVTALVFTLPLCGFLWLLNLLPPPSAEDEAERTARKPMNAKARKKFMTRFAPGLVLLIIAYLLLTAFRDFRDNFTPEIWRVTGATVKAEIFTLTEIPIAIIVLVAIGSLMLIKNNQLALKVNHLIIIAGLLLIGGSTFLFQLSLITATLWMILVGLGLYLAYVPFNSIFFERLLAAFKYVGTVGFVMYLADSFGYLGSVGILLFKEFGFKSLNWLQFFITTGYIVSLAGSVLIALSLAYFHFKYQRWRKGIRSRLMFF